MKSLVLMWILFVYCFAASAQDVEYENEFNIPYYNDSIRKFDAYINERCLLDIYYPKNLKDFPTIVWFHGGGLTGGEKHFPSVLKENGYCLVAVNYRLYPKVKSPKFIEDASAAVAWVFNNIKSYGGDTSLIFIAGYSAGGYLTNMIGLDKRWLQTHSIDANRIAGLISLSGHSITHFKIREERGIAETQPIIDDLAPLYHVRADAPPLILITGDRELEMLGRYEENAYMMRMMKVAGHTKTKLYEMDGYDHGMTQPAFPLLLKEVKRIVEEKRKRN